MEVSHLLRTLAEGVIGRVTIASQIVNPEAVVLSYI